MRILDLIITGSGIAYSLVIIGVMMLRGIRTPAHVFFVLGIGLLVAEAFLNGLSLSSLRAAEIVNWQLWSIAVSSVLPGIWVLFAKAYAYREEPWRLSGDKVLLVILFAVPLLLVLGFHRTLILEVQPLPEKADWRVVLDTPAILISLFQILAAVWVLMRLERTYRASVGTMRWSLKYIILAVGVLWVTRLYAHSQIFLFSSYQLSFRVLETGSLLAFCLLATVGLMRDRAFSIEVYPSKTVIYHSVTLVLAGAYLCLVGGLAQLVTLMGGDRAFPIKALLVLVLLLGLCVLFLSNRWRQRLSIAISRHFRRPQHDYRQVWSTFTERTASVMEETQFCRVVVQWISDTFQLLSASLWLVEEQRDEIRFGASTYLDERQVQELLNRVYRLPELPSVPEAGEEALEPSSAAAGGPIEVGALVVSELIEGLKGHFEPMDVEVATEAWAQQVRQLNPYHFPHGGHRFFVPLRAGNELVGFMALADRVSGVPMTIEDLDLLKCVSNQIGASLVKIRLSSRLIQTRETEAFQMVSTFFVHDLKNTVSTLSLMLANLQQHFDNPEFRQDAQRAVSKSVDRLNDLIGRLSQLRPELKMNLIEADLNQIVRGALTSLDGAAHVQVVPVLNGLPRLRVDAEQVQKVLVNLLLNARDAVGPGGRIVVETFQRGRWLGIQVQDNGCGMTPEFMNRSLFRPFQSTKKKGIGIGMYQSKMIIEAHHGRIRVKSQPGKGSQFQVLLPANAAA